MKKLHDNTPAIACDSSPGRCSSWTGNSRHNNTGPNMAIVTLQPTTCSEL